MLVVRRGAGPRPVQASPSAPPGAQPVLRKPAPFRGTDSRLPYPAILSNPPAYSTIEVGNGPRACLSAGSSVAARGGGRPGMLVFEGDGLASAGESAARVPAAFDRRMHSGLVGARGVRAVGLDLGRRRIGVAVSDPTGTLATPWRTVTGAGSAGAVAERVVGLLAELARDDAPVARVVVGRPRLLDARRHEDDARVTAVARAIGQRTGLPVALQDERLTSVEAEQRLAVRERDWRRRKARLDAAAAAVILQDHLDQGHLDARAGREGT